MDEPVAARKTALRRDLRRRRRELGAAQRARLSGAAVEHLLRLPEVVAARTIALYAATPVEADPATALDLLRERGVRVVLPRVAGPVLEFVDVTTGSELVPGFRGLTEPSGPAIDLGQVDVVVVPGVGFDARGGRLGQGGGHYDRTLPGLRADALRVGLAFSVQVVESIPREARDALLDVTVTELGPLRTHARA
ncbi:MAG: 5-formyltetrahydrofolate cyclo-ligase [Candidatus Dormibacteraeota bacterium]|nr:5-formyltetrahydrofolate cyclo-ligase [Candidatus Dormibacteraeota bacterium]